MKLFHSQGDKTAPTHGGFISLLKFEAAKARSLKVVVAAVCCFVIPLIIAASEYHLAEITPYETQALGGLVFEGSHEQTTTHADLQRALLSLPSHQNEGSANIFDHFDKRLAAHQYITDLLETSEAQIYASPADAPALIQLRDIFGMAGIIPFVLLALLISLKVMCSDHPNVSRKTYAVVPLSPLQVTCSQLLMSMSAIAVISLAGTLLTLLILTITTHGNIGSLAHPALFYASNLDHGFEITFLGAQLGYALLLGFCVALVCCGLIALCVSFVDSPFLLTISMLAIVMATTNEQLVASAVGHGWSTLLVFPMFNFDFYCRGFMALGAEDHLINPLLYSKYVAPLLGIVITAIVCSVGAAIQKVRGYWR